MFFRVLAWDPYFGFLGFRLFLCVTFMLALFFTQDRYRKTIVCLFFVFYHFYRFSPLFPVPRILPVLSFFQCFIGLSLFFLYIAAGSLFFTDHQIKLFCFIELILIICKEKAENGIEGFYTQIELEG